MLYGDFTMFKEDLLCKVYFYIVFEHNHVSLCTHPTYYGKDPSTPFVIFPINQKRCLKMSGSGMRFTMMSQLNRPRPRLETEPAPLA